ncbi:RSP protein [Arthroderma uncinatum]|uniref:RSP protein n=1 Tax=Arthroderma uncinatum TaxID=74035 RepID=UPI00144A737E|nr:RSP protein [Arthroderma uncinatum]KAF3490608.1 RSP protein [Arthroderma uncinatum]
METIEVTELVADIPLEEPDIVPDIPQDDTRGETQLEEDARRPSTESGDSIAPVSQDGYSFKRWMRSIRANRHAIASPRNYVMGWPDDETMDESYNRPAGNYSESVPDTASVTSSALLRTMETASVSQATMSVINRPRTNTMTSTKQGTSVFSNSEARRSIDSNRMAATLSLDEAAWNRAVQRRQIIQELVGTETVYVSGLKALGDLPKFKIYEDYGIKYHLVSQEIDDLRKTVNFQIWDHGTEALSRSVAPLECQELSPNQALTINDLLAKPIQRVCKYQLFLSDLLKCTPSSDCPAAREALELAHQSKDRMAKTLLLQNKLDFTDFGKERDILRDFGPIKVCGILHVTYETLESITGDYMVCALFSSHLLLAAACIEHRNFTVVAIIGTTRAKIESVDEKPGLQCLRTPHSWKTLYVAGGCTFELVMTACSTKEAVQWMDQLHQNIAPEITVDTPKIGTKVKLPIKQRPVITIDETGNIVQPVCKLVRIKGTEAVPRLNQPSSTSLSRSPTMFMNPIVTLTPNRQDRMRMERWLANIWTCDIIPYPGMPGRSEYFIRAQAGSFLRSLSSRRPFARRSSSMTTTTTQSITSPPKGGAGMDDTDMTTPTSPISKYSTREFDDIMDISPRSRSSSPARTPLLTLKYGPIADEMVQHEAQEKDLKEIKEVKEVKGGKRPKWSVSLFKAPSRSRRAWPVEV